MPDLRLRILSLAALALLAACKTTQRPAPQGFLIGYDLAPAEDGSGALVWRRPDLSLADYDKILLEPVRIFAGPDADFEDVDPIELKRLADAFEDAILAALVDRYAFVDAPGPGVLRLRVAITDVVPRSMPLRDVLGRASTGLSFELGEIAMEAELLDARSGERLAAFVDRRLTKPADEERSAFTLWAGRLRQRLDESRAPAGG